VGRELLLIVLAMSIFFGVIPAALFFKMYRRKQKYGSFLASKEESIGSRLRRQKPSTPRQKLVPVCLYGFCAALYTVTAVEDPHRSALRWVAAAAFWVGTILFAVDAWRAFRKQARLKRLQRREGFMCPSCGEAPQIGDLWGCKQCHKAFDTFQTLAVCPYCATQHASTACPNCKEWNPMSAWVVEGRSSVSATNEGALAD